MGSTNAVRAWLLIMPRPKSLRLTCDGEFRNIPVTSTWAATAQSIEALDADLVEALDDEGNVLRAIKPESLEDEPDKPNETNTAISKAIAIDGETERFRLFATLISDAYKYGYEVAFTKMVELFAAVNSRTESIEKSLGTTERMLRKRRQSQTPNGTRIGRGWRGRVSVVHFGIRWRNEYRFGRYR